MKKILWLTFIFTLLFVSHSFAATYNLTAKPPTDNTITATLTGAIPGDIYKLVLQTENFTSSTYTGKTPTALDAATDPAVKQASATGVETSATVTWTIPGNKANTTYYVRVLEAKGVTAKYITDTSTITTKGVNILFDKLTTEKDGNDIVVKGRITDKTYPLSKYKATLYFTKQVPPSGATTLSGGIGPINSRKTAAANGSEGINNGEKQKSTVNINGTSSEVEVEDAGDGTYYWRLSSLSPSTTYYIQQTVSDGNNSVTGTIETFNSSTGNIVASSTDQASYDAAHSYKLLSGFPNFTVLPDPDLCAQQRASGLNPKFCDMNDVINYFLKLLIGLSAVVLVFRLMYEGFIILTSDLPFKIASAKGSFFAALGGLLLAMSSYIILNTINPKLVNSTVGITQLTLGVTDSVDEGALTYDGKNTYGYNQPKKFSGENACPGKAGSESQTCIPLPVPSNKTNKKIEIGTGAKLVSLNNALKAKGIAWVVTEAYPATSSHKSGCHGNGTCFDMDITGGEITAAQAITIISAAQSVGFCPNVEIPKSKASAFVAAGVPSGRIWTLESTGGTGTHFHVVTGTCK